MSIEKLVLIEAISQMLAMRSVFCAAQGFELKASFSDAKTKVTAFWNCPVKGACKASAWFKPVPHISDAERSSDVAASFASKMLGAA